MWYIASPYSHPDPEVMEQRFDKICRITGDLMSQGVICFSPIAHTPPIAVRCELPRGWDFWQKFDREMIRAADKVLVVCLDGWKESKGITAEIEIAKEFRIPVQFLYPVAEVAAK